MTRKYWVVSPNVRANEKTVGAWRSASVRLRSAFMGWQPNDQGHARIGPRFAGEKPSDVKPGDVILIARRHRGTPEIVGFGVVKGKRRTKFRRNQLPEMAGSSRSLDPFVPWSRPPNRVPLLKALRHTMALAQLRPDKDPDHKRVVDWLEKQLGRNGLTASPPRARRSKAKARRAATKIVAPENNSQLDYKVRTAAAVRNAQRREAKLVDRYSEWIKHQGRKIQAIRIRVGNAGVMRCDAYEKARGNLIEAKQSVDRAYVRMAVGQLLDYRHSCLKKRVNIEHMAVLLPTRPTREVEEWLSEIAISTIWEDGEVFLDNANGQFT